MTKREADRLAHQIWRRADVLEVIYRLRPGRNWSLEINCMDGLSVDVTSAEAWATWAADHNIARRA